ncbi:cysteine hydrolase family protein [Pseudomonas sp. 148P]|uniref:Cysteine hydrolase family protein n=1 Tax=Pseudomonas ulcerans TaxID=3115852 RepID=A0ABU7HQP3_9PSED|nr:MULTISPECIES: cysteine hydrolase family protein [unclassified Pseudomonas]MEE1923790.1 cysteine hydrolase family protein [Pseudomonas sp. 147P]MEE1933850.1 cysteine hydrolase family protein [Pseudomonas sp. 148P]
MHALLILDLQVGLFHGADKPWRGDELLGTVNTLLDQAHAAGAPVFLARHVGPPGSPLAPDSALTQLIPELRLDGSETVFEKQRPSAFVGTGLLERLKETEVRGVVICGMKTQYCVDSTCRAARDLGLDAVLVEDGHGCSDTPLLKAEAIVAHHNATLAGAFCRVVKAREWRF